MLRLAPTIRLLQAPLGGWVVPKAHITAKPAKTPTSPKASEQDRHSQKGPWTCSKQPDTTPDMHKSAGNRKGGGTSCSVGSSSRSRNRPALRQREQAIGLSVTFLSFLLPAGWVLYHLDNYKKSSAA
ncbi:cytochrome c oxidase subunit 8B, mitochondrial-like [Dama dama]